MTKLVLLTGFLGAGKTTLMQEILHNYGTEKTGVIVNDFGEVNVDAKLISKEGIHMAELSNGSVFCACIKDKFVDSLIEMSEMQLEYLFIEASGLADPANMAQILKGIEGSLSEPYEYKGSVCIVDGESFIELYQVLPAITYQLEYCSAVVINKGDLIDEEQLKVIAETIDKINPEAKTCVTSYCKVDIRKLIERITQRSIDARDSSNTVESRPLSFVLKGIAPVSCEELEAFLKEIVPNAYRIKGFIDTDQGMMEISCVGTNVHVRPWNAAGEQTAIVVISSVGFKMMSILTKAIRNNVKGKLYI